MPKKRHKLVVKRVTALSFVALVVASIFGSFLFTTQPVSAAANEWINRGTIRYNDKIYSYDGATKAGSRDVFYTDSNKCNYHGTSDYKVRYLDALLVSADGRTAHHVAVDKNNTIPGGGLNCETFPEVAVSLGNQRGRHAWFYLAGNQVISYSGLSSFTALPAKVNGATVYTAGSGNCYDIIVQEGGGRWLFFPMMTHGSIKSAFPPARTAASEDYRTYSGISTAMDAGDGGCRTASQKMILNYKVGDPQTWIPHVNSTLDVCGAVPGLPKWVGELDNSDLGISSDVMVNDIVLACRHESQSGADRYHLTVPQCHNAPSDHCSRPHIWGDTAQPNVTNALIKFSAEDFTPLNWDNGYVVVVPITTDAAPPQGANPVVGTNPNTAPPTCDASNEKLGWIMCPVLETLGTIVRKLDNTVLCALKINTAKIFNDNAGSTTCAGHGVSASTQKSSNSYHLAWSVFRNFALALLVILALIMVASQVLGLEIFDAYAIRKMLPRLIIAVILLSLSWNIMQFLFTMSNAAADAVRALIWTPFNSDLGKDYSLTTTQSIIAGILGIAGAPVSVIAATAYISIVGLGGVLALVGSVALFVLSAWILLVARDVVATMLILAAPVAIICAVFEPFQKLFNLWKGLLTTILISVPIVAAMIQTTHVAALISKNGDTTGVGTITALAILVAGYALIWVTFKKIDTVAGQLGGVVNNVTGGAQKALSNFRGESAKRRLNDVVEGKREFGGGILGWGGRRAAGIVRRGRLAGEVGAGAFGFGRAGRAKYNEAVRTMHAGVAAKMMEQDKDRAGGDDDAMRLLGRRGMNQGRFIREYADIQQRRNANMDRGEAEQRARRALGLSESSLGANAGTNAMRVAAQKSLLKSNTSYRRQQLQRNGRWVEEEMDFKQMSRTMYGDVAELVQDGLITDADGAAMIKSNGARADRANVGFGAAMSQVGRVARGGVATLDERVEPGNPNNMTTHLDTMLDDVLTGSSPGQWTAQRHEAVRMLAPEMQERLRRTIQSDYAGNNHLTLGRPLAQIAASAAATVDTIGSLADLNRDPVANAFLGARIRPPRPGEREDQVPTTRELVEFYRTAPQANRENRLYQEIHRNYVNEIAARTGRAVTDNAVIDTAHEETVREITDAQRVFNEHRREYNTPWQAGATAPPPGP